MIIKIPINDIKFNILDKEEVEIYLKELMINLKRRNPSISGFYDVKIYHNKKYGLIIYITKEDDLELFKELIDLKITVYDDSTMYMEVNDYFLIKDCKDIYASNNKYYIDIEELTKDQILSLSEFSRILLKDEFKKYNAIKLKN